jgi:RHS repeat-associated protein
MGETKAGNVTTATLADGLTYKGDAVVAYAYDDAYRLTREKCTPGGGSSRMAYDYRYYFDGVGNRTKFIRTDLWTSDRTVVYEYSARNELTRYSDPEGTGKYWVCEYDLRGNRTKWRHTFWTDSWYSYEWDAQDRLTKVYSNSNTKTTEYKYDHAGRRATKKVDSGAWRWYSYDGLKVVAEGTSSTSKMYYTTAPGDPGGIICRDASAGTNPLYYHYDRLGNVMAVTDSNGALCAPYTMDAFGNVLQCGTSTGYSATQSDPQPYHLTTKEWDPDTALFYFNARWYLRETGRFLSRDPIAAANGTNYYYFATSNPIGFVDPNGLAACSWPTECDIAKEAARYCDRKCTGIGIWTPWDRWGCGTKSSRQAQCLQICFRELQSPYKEAAKKCISIFTVNHYYLPVWTHSQAQYYVDCGYDIAGNCLGLHGTPDAWTGGHPIGPDNNPNDPGTNYPI